MPTHNHNIVYGKNAFGAGNYDNNSIIWTQSRTKTTTENTGGNNSHNNLQPYIVQNFIIKAYNNARTLSIVENSLSSTSIANALSAAQGKILNEKINTLTTYSTNEVKTGETWIDGKPIYRKVIQVTSTSGNTTEIDLSSLNISTIFFDLSKSYYKWNAHTRILPVISVNVEAGTASSTDVAKNQCGVYYNYSNKKMVCEFGNSRKIYNGVVTIEYTKTTD